MLFDKPVKSAPKYFSLPTNDFHFSTVDKNPYCALSPFPNIGVFAPVWARVKVKVLVEWLKYERGKSEKISGFFFSDILWEYMCLELPLPNLNLKFLSTFVYHLNSER